MGKYGPGTLMKTVITEETKMVHETLQRSNLSEEDQSNIMNAFREMAYQWCDANATTCAVEDAVTSIYGEKVMEAVTTTAMTSGVHERKMAETYPFE